MNSGTRCAIHQPNFFPRLSTLTKIFTADTWVVLDDVQFVRRDYQHRARIAELNSLTQQRWLSVAVHLPNGRATLIRDMRLADAGESRRRIAVLLQQHYWQSPHWPTLHHPLTEVLHAVTPDGGPARVAELSTRMLLRLLGWHGTVIRSSDLSARSGRSERLADLTGAVGATTYVCGTGGARYLDPKPFSEIGISVEHFAVHGDTIWLTAHKLSALHSLMTIGPEALGNEIRSQAFLHHTRGTNAANKARP